MILIHLMPDLFIGSFIIWIIVGNIMRLMALVKCFGRKKCRHANCPFKYFCCKEPDFTSEEYTRLLDELQKMIDDKRKELGTGGSL